MAGDRGGERGQATVLMALFLSLVLLGFFGFALDIGLFFRERRMAQASADAAALAAAEEQSYGNTTSQMQSAANAAATLNGFNTSLASGPAIVTLSTPSTGMYSTAASSSAPAHYVQATVYEPIHGIFFSAFNGGSTSLNITATAIAGTGSGSTSACVCLEGTSGETLNMSNNAKLSAPSCGITVDSTSSNAAGVVGSANVSAVELGIASTTWVQSNNVNNGGSISSGTKVVTSYSPSCAPAMPAVPSHGTCSADPFNSIGGGGVTYTVGPGSTYGTTTGGDTVCYTGLTVGANGDTVTLNTGIYVISGGTLHFESGGNRGGSGVVFYLTNGASVSIDNGANISLSAPTSGTYNGILIYQDASDSSTLSIQGGASTTMNGALLAPNAAITLGNGSGSSITAAIVAQSLTMNGGGTLTASATANIGSMGQGSPRLTQ
jgi:Flp pilus assembly protein TadG